MISWVMMHHLHEKLQYEKSDHAPLSQFDNYFCDENRNAEYGAEFTQHGCINGTRNTRRTAADKAQHANWPCSVLLCFHHKRNCGIHFTPLLFNL